jgi:hypothetical protein
MPLEKVIDGLPCSYIMLLRMMSARMCSHLSGFGQMMYHFDIDAFKQAGYTFTYINDPPTVGEVKLKDTVVGRTERIDNGDICHITTQLTDTKFDAKNDVWIN